ncbi:MAG: thioredoxin family protein [Paracoccaceae bacterium]|nr:thioredoxin family protein [Paracoccaceae bacterium]
MANPPACRFNWQAPSFKLPATDNTTYTLADISGANGTLVMFICNHCPYVTSVITRLIEDAKIIQTMQVGVVAISANDAVAYPEDSYENMQKIARLQQFPFAYLYDQDQTAARAYDAVCTPDFFGFNAQGGLQYRGRLDAAGRNPAPPEMRRDLVEAMQQIAATGQGPQDQVPSMGCSIKWRAPL